MPTWVLVVVAIVVAVLVLPRLLSPLIQRFVLRNAIRNAHKMADQFEAEGKHEQAKNLRQSLDQMKGMQSLDQVVESTARSLREQGRHEDAAQYEKIAEYARDNMGVNVKRQDQKQSGR